MPQSVFTRQCSDGRACSGFWNSPSYIPDDKEVCDFCLVVAFELEEVHATGCNCCEVSEDAVSTATVAVAIRKLLAGAKYPRFFGKLDMQMLDSKGEPTDDWKLNRGHQYWGSVYDSSEPWQTREPIETFPGQDGYKKAVKRAKELNEEDV